MNSGYYGRVGRSSLAPLKDRQYQTSSAMTEAIATAFDAIRAVLKTKSVRVVELVTPKAHRFVMASLLAPWLAPIGYILFHGACGSFCDGSSRGMLHLPSTLQRTVVMMCRPISLFRTISESITFSNISLVSGKQWLKIAWMHVAISHGHCWIISNGLMGKASGLAFTMSITQKG